MTAATDPQVHAKPLLIGEANPYGSDPEFALYPDPPNCAGHRLCHKVMGLDPDDYLRRFDRANLCPREWRLKEARVRATLLRSHVRGLMVLLGARVCAAFEVDFKPFSETGYFTNAGRSDVGPQVYVPQYVVLPHPSGLSRSWNAPGAYDRARLVLREAGVLP